MDVTSFVIGLAAGIVSVCILFRVTAGKNSKKTKEKGKKKIRLIKIFHYIIKRL